MTRLETERLVLRLPRLEDGEPMIELTTDPEVMRYMGGVHPDAVADPLFVIRRWLDRWDANGYGQLVAERRSDGAVLGRVGLVVWDTREWQIATVDEAGEYAQPELGWAFIRTHWGHGYATEGALAARRWAREQLGIERLVSIIHPENDRSRRVAEKLGCISTETVTIADSGPAVVWVHPTGV